MLKSINPHNQTAIYIIDDTHSITVDTNSQNIIESPQKSRLTKKVWRFDSDKEMFYTLTTNDRPMYLVEFITGRLIDSHEFHFLNDNKFDYRKENIQYCHIAEKNIQETILERHPGHIMETGKNAKRETNPYWLVENNKTNEKYYIMYCESKQSSVFTKISPEDIGKVLYFNGKNMSWHLHHETGYIMTKSIPELTYHLHSHIMDHYCHGKGQISVDHINRDKLDNRRLNLRIESPSVQNANTDKRNRKKDAQVLPEELGNIKLPKFVTYNREKMKGSAGTTYYRDFFRIEKHPKHPQTISTTKSTKVSITDKLQEAIDILNKIENGSDAKKPKTFPTYVTQGVDKRSGRPTLLFEKRDNGKKQTITYSLKDEKTLKENYDIFKEKVSKKYNYILDDMKDTE